MPRLSKRLQTCPNRASVVRLGHARNWHGSCFVSDVGQLQLTTDEIAVARTILCYLFARPRARDSVKTIAERWIRRQRLEETVATIRRVLAALVQDGLILEFEDPPGFGVNRQRLDDIADFIKTSDPGSNLSKHGSRGE